MNDPRPPDFNDPLGVLRADHEHVLEHCETLAKLPSQVTQNGVDEEARRAISRVVNYFTTSAVHHHQDKAQNLFPILNRQSLKLADIIYRLKREHGELASSWERIRGELKTPAALQHNEAFAAQVEKFCHDYRQHLAYESRELLAIAQHVLSQRQLDELGDAMAKRRGVKR